MSAPDPGILTGPQKAVIGAVLSTLALVAATFAAVLTGPVSVALAVAAGLLGTVGVPWGIYVTVNKPVAPTV